MNWITYKKGESIGKTGSESGTILIDIENIGGARLTLEKDGAIAPYSVTLGIYDLMFHTYFASTLEEANKYLEFAKFKTQEIIYHYEVPENLRDDHWQKQLDVLISELTAQA